MSVESLAVVLNHSRASGTAKLILIGIANHAGDGGAWPSVETLAGYANIKRRAVQNHLRTLVDLGELAITYNAGGTIDQRDDQRPNRYDVLVECPPGCDRTAAHRVSNGVQNVAPRERHGVQDRTERGAGSRRHGVQDSAPKPSFNHPRTAAAASGRVPLDELPPALQRLRSAFAATDSLRGVSFARLTTDTAEALADVVDRLGVERMVVAVRNTNRPPRYVQAFAGDWTDMPPSLAVVEDVAEPMCPGDCGRPDRLCEAAERNVAPAERCAGRTMTA